jgi:hypothetical protein
MKRSGGLIAAMLAVAALLAPTVLGQSDSPPAPVRIPPDAIGLEGIPTVRVDAAEGGATRRVLTAAESAKSRLRVKIIDGQYYWTSRDNRRLRLDASGPFTYLSSEPGSYVKLTRINDTLAYLEHVDMPTGSVTWWGELQIVVRK